MKVALLEARRTSISWSLEAFKYVLALNPGVARVCIDGFVVAEDVGWFLGIPYAAPPVGDLCWRPPAAPANWTGERDAS